MLTYGHHSDQSCHGATDYLLPSIIDDTLQATHYQRHATPKYQPHVAPTYTIACSVLLSTSCGIHVLS
jgi:hypothetical protein